MKAVGVAMLAVIAAVAPWKKLLACTICFDETAQAVRASVFGPDMWLNLGMTLLPLVIIAPAVLIYDRWRDLVGTTEGRQP